MSPARTQLLNGVILLTFAVAGLGICAWLFIRGSRWLLIAAPLYMLGAYLLAKALPAPSGPADD